MANRDSPSMHYPRPGMAGPGIRLDPYLFEARCVRTDFDHRITVGWISRRYQLDQHIGLRGDWAEGNPRALDLLVEYISRFVGGMIELLDGNVDSRAEIEALLPMFQRQITARMERIEHQARVKQRMREDSQYVAIPRYVFDDELYAPPSESPAAKKKATALLLKNLNQEQAIAFNEKKEFEVVGKDGKNYRITKARSFNVIGPDGTKYCGQTVDTPIEDQMLAQKLLLERDPETFFKNANVLPARGFFGAVDDRARLVEEMIALGTMWRGEAPPDPRAPPPATAPAPGRPMTATQITMLHAPTLAEVDRYRAARRIQEEMARNYMDALSLTASPPLIIGDPSV